MPRAIGGIIGSSNPTSGVFSLEQTYKSKTNPTFFRNTGVYSLSEMITAVNSNQWVKNTLEWFLIGGGGAGGTAGGWSFGAPGGAGGGAYGKMDQPLNGAFYYVTVGGGGLINSNVTVSGGGGIASRNGTDNRYGGGGGGYSGVFLSSPDNQADALMIAGGGGGGGSSRAGTGNAGGAGGGLDGQDGASPYGDTYEYRGQGGAQGGPGGQALTTSPTNAGFQSALLGGSPRTNSYGGAGGGGYFGGSAGGYIETNTMAGGGGGSGFIKPFTFYDSLAIDGDRTTVGLIPFYNVGPYGNAGGVGSNGTGGVVIARYPGTTVKGIGGTITNDGSYTYHTFTSGNTAFQFYSFYQTTFEADPGNGRGFPFFESISSAVTGFTNNSLLNYHTFATNNGTCDGDWLNFNHTTTTANFAFNSGNLTGWWPAWAAVNVTTGRPVVLNQVRWKKHPNAIGNVNIWGSNRDINISNFNDITFYTFLGRVHFGGTGSGGSDGDIVTRSFNSNSFGYRWYLFELVDNNNTGLVYPAVGGRGNWAMYGLTLDKV